MPTKLNKIEVRYDKRYLPLPWIVVFVSILDESGANVAESKIDEPIHDADDNVNPQGWSKWRTRALALEDAKAQQRVYPPSSLRVKGKDGEYKFENTYPRSADPAGSPGVRKR